MDKHMWIKEEHRRIDQAKQGTLWWFGHMEKMEEELLVMKMIGYDVRGETVEKETKNGIDG